MENPASIPDYTVRRSARARRVRLTVSARHGLVVVVPKSWRGDVAGIVASKHAWAVQALANVAEQRAAYLGGPAALLPDEVELRAQGRTLAVRYEPTGASTARARECQREGESVLVVGGSSDPAAQLAALRRWLLTEAKRWLPPRAHDIARVHRIPAPDAIRISSARTRWGSCSANRRLSLNRTLLFLPHELADYVIAHELAHLTHMNHSPRFWATLAEMDERALEHRAAMKGAGARVPAWVDA